jgi:complex III assembly factor LYRM7
MDSHSSFPFSSDDTPTLHAARAYARSEFERHQTTESGSVAAATAVEHAQGVTKILREHVVQGRHEGEGKYKLNIHEHTQRLDNDTAGQLKGTTKSWREVKDAVF